MLIKNADDATAWIAALEVRAAGKGPEARQAEAELRNRKAGLRGERDSAYLIDFDFAQSGNWAVLHDLRLEHGSRTAQIDHLLINRWMQVYVLESKHFHAGVKITEEGEFLRWNGFDKRFEGMASPLEQNERHIQVLRDVFGTLDLPTRAGLRITPEFMSFVLVAPKARIDRPRKFDTARVIKADQLKKAIWKDIDGESPLLGLIKTAAKMIGSETVRGVAEQLAARHKPVTPPRVAMSPAAAPGPEVQRAPPTPMPATEPKSRASNPSPTQSNAATAAPTCKHCQGKAGQVLHGKFGYYFRCEGCAGNTAIRFTCQPGHDPRLRKEGARFFRECAQCGSSELYHTNQVP